MSSLASNILAGYETHEKVVLRESKSTLAGSIDSEPLQIPGSLVSLGIRADFSAATYPAGKTASDLVARAKDLVIKTMSLIYTHPKYTRGQQINIFGGFYPLLNVRKFQTATQEMTNRLGELVLEFGVNDAGESMIPVITGGELQLSLSLAPVAELITGGTGEISGIIIEIVAKYIPNVIDNFKKLKLFRSEKIQVTGNGEFIHKINNVQKYTAFMLLSYSAADAEAILYTKWYLNNGGQQIAEITKQTNDMFSNTENNGVVPSAGITLWKDVVGLITAGLNLTIEFNAYASNVEVYLTQVIERDLNKDY